MQGWAGDGEYSYASVTTPTFLHSDLLKQKDISVWDFLAECSELHFSAVQEYLAPPQLKVYWDFLSKKKTGLAPFVHIKG